MQSLATPSYSLTAEEKLHVYEPAEDSFLLMDALESDFERIQKLQPTICVEIGCGSGVVSTFLSKHLNEIQQNAIVFSTDINPRALTVTVRNASANGADVNCVQTNLVDALKQRLNSCVDLLVFNPPYVPTNDIVNSDDYLAHSYAGGVNGISTLLRLFPDVYELLSPRGIFYVVALVSNDVERLLKIDDNLKGSVFMERKCGIERLFVLKFVKKCSS